MSQVLSPLDSKQVNSESAGRFIAASFSSCAGSRHYKLYIPKDSEQAKPLALVVMLHACSQNADDFAKGTRMNELAEQEPCYVLYPEQSSTDDGAQCWHWYQHEESLEQGEPAIIAGLTQQIIQEYNIDASRVYVAGFSAGGAMAINLAALYPTLYAAVGSCSGLAYQAAHDVFSAFAVMDGGAKTLHKVEQAPPIIVFQGEQDYTVNAKNAEQIIKQFVSSELPPEIMPSETTAERAYTRRVYFDEDGHRLAELWLVHGAGHAWPGGSAKGSFTDPAGPNASQEILRFFNLFKRA
ncbi:MAG: PHB depolymerase family esterase [Aeromonadales bacterium]|nr:PHB depolymerase family esterase [Aeromonadales bacterium]